MRRAIVSFVAALTLASPALARAQQRGTDVGGQPARRQITKMPRLVKLVAADAPEQKDASVVLTIEIAATGRVSAVEVAQSSGLPSFDRAEVTAARQFQFEPAEVDEKPAPSKITYRYQFTLSP